MDPDFGGYFRFSPKSDNLHFEILCCKLWLIVENLTKKVCRKKEWVWKRSSIL